MAMEVERERSLADAEQCIDTAMAALGLGVSLQRHGQALSSTVATVHGSGIDSTRDCVGCGKGTPDEARTGAKFEAYEHFHAVPALRAASRVADIPHTLAQPALADTLPVRMLVAQAPGLIGVLPLERLDADEPALDYPLFLIDHTYASQPLDKDTVDYHHARRYACGTGIAAGVGRNEALVHAVSEVIERHAVGTWIAQTYYRGHPESERPIDPATLPAALSDLLRQASAALGAHIVLSHAASDIDCPVVMARCVDRQICGLHVAGSGASLHAEHAAARAIKELVQQYKVVEGEPEALLHWQRCGQRLQQWPRLQPCLALAPGSGEAPVSFADLGGLTTRLPLDIHLQTLLERCADAQRPVWSRVLREDAADVTLACAVMPRMERFAVAALGGVVVPCYA